MTRLPSLLFLLLLPAIGCDAAGDPDTPEPLDGAAGFDQGRIDGRLADAGAADALVDTSPPDAAPDLHLIEVSSDFESGSIGRIRQLADDELRLSLRDDNDDPTLPDSYRSWWYVRLDDVPTDRPLNIRITHRGFPDHYVPVVSYDNEVWERLADEDVTSTASSVRMSVTFEAPTVWLARFYPYPQSQLEAYLDEVQESVYVIRETIGESVQGRPLEMLTLTDPNLPDESKRRVWLHGRTHPAETGSSFLLEGLIDFLLSGDPDAEAVLARFVINVVPMHNVDGVAAGNYRTTPESVNLESAWLTDPNDPFELLDAAPQEVHVLRDAFAGLLASDDALPVAVAINLHSSNSPPDRPAFFFPHFGPEEAGYDADEVALWRAQVAFIEAVTRRYGEMYVEAVPAQGGSSFTENHFPETWWWLNYGPSVMAITLETVYGRAGFERWVTPDEMRDLGVAVGRALLDDPQP